MLRKFISYFYPLTRKIKSEFNGYLELTLVDGKTLLNTANTNYSYGSLQRVLRFALLHINLKGCNNILVLGLGGGCVLKTLRNEFNFSGNITAVDIDPVIIKIAETEYSIVSDIQTTIICSDAFEFISRTNNKYDLIIIDLFVDNKIPERFLLVDFWREILNKTNDHGNIIFNTLCIPYSDTQTIENKFKKRGFDWEVLRYVENTNRVLIARRH